MTLNLSLKTLTPIWTGDVDRSTHRLRETGLLGGLRWWYEGLLRAQGREACDAVSGGCGKCDACLLFGHTGSSRQFRLVATAPEHSTAPLVLVSNPEIERAHRGWLGRVYPRDARVFWAPDFTLRFLVRRLATPGEAGETFAKLAALARLVCNFGCLGARGQNGFGQVALRNAIPRDLIEEGKRLLAGDGSGQGEDGCFDLSRFFHLSFQLRARDPYQPRRFVVGAAGADYLKDVIPCAFDIRYKSSSSFAGGRGDFGMRPWLADHLGRGAAGQLLGESRARSDDKRRASRIYVSHLFRRAPNGPWLLNIFGDVPRAVGSVPAEVAKEVQDFICGPRGMFPGSTATLRLWPQVWEEL